MSVEKEFLRNHVGRFERLIKEMLIQFDDANLMMMKVIDDVKDKNYVDKDDALAMEFTKKYFEVLVMMVDKYLDYLKKGSDEDFENEQEEIKQYIRGVMSEIGLER